MLPLVSIIVPNYNHEEYLHQRLESIFKQTYTNFEVILMDDCSTDNSLKILKKYCNHEKVSICVFNNVNSGNTFKQWVKGIDLAKGDLIWIAETDDYCDINFLEKLIPPFQQDNQVALVYCQSNRVNEVSEITGNWITYTDSLDANLFLKNFTMESNEFIKKFLIYRNVIPNASAVLFRKRDVNNTMHFDISPQFTYCGDWMFYFKLIVNKKIVFISDSLNNFRHHSTSVIANAVKSKNRIQLIDIEYKMRHVLMKYLKQNVPTLYYEIKSKNDFIERNYLAYEKSFLLIKTGNKIKGCLLLLSVFDVFCKKYNFKKNLLIKIKKFY